MLKGGIVGIMPPPPSDDEINKIAAVSEHLKLSEHSESTSTYAQETAIYALLSS